MPGRRPPSVCGRITTTGTKPTDHSPGLPPSPSLMPLARTRAVTAGSYLIEWSEAALEDLLARVKYQWVADELINVAQTSLDHHHPPDGGTAPPLYWRRGLTAQSRTTLDAAQSRGEDHDDDEQPWHYVLYYRRQPRIIGRHGYVVLAVLRDTELLAALLNL
jgi:hypothetical protein